MIILYEIKYYQISQTFHAEYEKKLVWLGFGRTLHINYPKSLTSSTQVTIIERWHLAEAIAVSRKMVIQKFFEML